jgi:hypothetical protein
MLGTATFVGERTLNARMEVVLPLVLVQTAARLERRKGLILNMKREYEPNSVETIQLPS